MEPAPFDQSVAPLPARDGNLVLAIACGALAAILGAVLWAAFTAATNLRLGFAAVGVGYLVGLVVRRTGHGHTPVFGYAAAVLALLGCVVGDVLADCAFIATQAGRPVLDVVGHLTPSLAVDLLKNGFQALDVLFYFLAVSAGYRNAFSTR